MDPGKVKAILKWEPPQTRRQLQSFLEFCKFLLPFIPMYAQIVLLIVENGRENEAQAWQPLKWSLECQAAFEKLNHLFAAELVLKHLNPDESFMIQADTSDVAVGAVLFKKMLRENCSHVPMHPTNFVRPRGTELFERRKLQQSEGLS